MMEAVSTIMGINFFSEWKLFSTSTSIEKLTNCSQHCRRVDRGVLFFCGSPSMLWFDPRLHLKQSISYLPGHHLLPKFSLCIYSCPGTPITAACMGPFEKQNYLRHYWLWQWQIHIDVDNLKSKERWKWETLRVMQTAFISLTMFFERYLNI